MLSLIHKLGQKALAVVEKLKLRNTKKILAIGVAIATLCCVLGLKSTPVQAAAGINKQINFQGKLVNTDGTNVPDGMYNLQFKLYDASSSGTNLWTEEWLRNNSQGVVVTNGVFQVALGSITSLPGSVNFNTDNIYLTMNVGNTNATCTPFNNCSGDGEMSPRVRFTASPYAFNADALDGLDATNFVQLAQGLQTDSSTSNASIAINKTGSTADIIDIQRGGSSILKINNTGLATFKPASGGDSATAFQVQNAAGPTTIFDVDTQNSRVGINTAAPTADLSFGAGSNRTINVNTPTGSNTAGNSLSLTAGAGNGNAAGGDLNLTAGAAGASAAANAGGNVTIAGGSGTNADNNGGNVNINGGTALGTGTKGTVNIGSSNTSQVNVNAPVTFQSAASSSAFLVQNANSVGVFTVDTASSVNLITNPGFEANSTGWSQTGGASIARSTNAHFIGSYGLEITTTAANHGARYSYTFSPSTTYTLSFYINPSSLLFGTLKIGHNDNGSDTDDCTATATTGWGRLSCTFTSGGTISGSSFYLRQSDATGRTIDIDAVQLETGSADTSYSQNGYINLDTTVTSAFMLQNKVDSSDGFVVNNSSGTSIFNINTATGGVSIQGSLGMNGGVGGFGTRKIDLATSITSSDSCTFGCQGFVHGITITSPSAVGVTAGAEFRAATGAASFTQSTLYTLHVTANTLGSGSTITNNYGFKVDAQTAGTSDYGIAVDAADTQTLWLSSNANNTSASAGIAFGSSRDTNLYRSAADTLATDDSFIAAGSILSSSSTGGIGYATGAGGTVTQAGSKTNGVTINKVTGVITMNGSSLANGTNATFVVTNSTVASTDVIILNQVSGTLGGYNLWVTAVANGSFTATLRNISGGSLSQAVTINFAVIKGVSS